MIESRGEVFDGELTLRMVIPHVCGNEGCPSRTVVCTSEAFDGDWCAVGTLEVSDGIPDEVMHAALDHFIDGDSFEYVERILACFGVGWDELDADVMGAQLKMMQGPPAWFLVEFMSFSPEQLARLRAWIADDQGGFVEALHAIHKYRHSVDRRVPIHE